MQPKPASECACRDEALFGKIVTAAFGQRRKTLRNTLRDYVSDADFVALDINPQARGETLSLQDYVHIADYLVGRK